jgi:hypothetical protein
LRWLVGKHLLLTAKVYQVFDRIQQLLVLHGLYRLPAGYFGDPFDMEMSAWTYRKVNETDPFPAGYAPLGVEGGIAKQKTKMDLLWQELERRNIPISVVVYPQPALVLHDTTDSRHVRMWREWCAGNCRRFISLFPAFLAVEGACPRSQPGCWYLSHFTFGDWHYNAAGNALVADEVIKSLTEVPPVKRPGTNPGPESGQGLVVH